MLGPPGWFPDPSGLQQLRWFDGWQWTDWVSAGGSATQMPLTPPATGGGTLVTEPVLVTRAVAPGSFKVTTATGVDLATASDPDGQGRRLDVADPTGYVVLRLRRTGLGSSATVSARIADSQGPSELGRFELSGPGGHVRVLARGALIAVAGVPAPDLGPVGVIDPDGAGLGRIQRSSSAWTTELARPLGDPLHPLVALVAVAIELMELAR